jgi:hypothetical protein
MRRLVVVGCLLSMPACSSDAGDDGDTGLTSGASDELAPFVLRCDPAADDPCATFGSVSCCSDDPAALLLVEGELGDDVLPNYLGGDGSGTPLFSGGNNPLSRSGYCLVEENPPSVSLADVNAQGCRVPCNPTWSPDDIAAMCGPSAQCCQVVELEPADCVLDPELGDGGCFRPVTGNDITGLGSLDASDWSSTDHATHQDPGGLSCQTFAQGISGAVPIDPNEVLIECFQRLTVANQRGSCFQTTELASCPFAGPGYVDACEQMNNDQSLTGCG